MDAAADQVLDWQNVIMAFCFTSALELAKAKAQLSPAYYVLSYAIFLTFLSLFLSKLIAHKFTFASEVLQKVAIVIAATAFVFSTTIPFPMWLKCASWALYAVSLLTIVICNFIEEIVNLAENVFFQQPLLPFPLLRNYLSVSVDLER